MKTIRKISKCLNSRVGSYIFYILGVLAFSFFKSSEFAYGWIAELYPLGEKFIPVLLGVICIFTFILLAYILLITLVPKENSAQNNRIIKIVHIISQAVTAILFIYTFVLLFGLDKGFYSESISNGLRYLKPNLPLAGIFILAVLPLLFCEKPKKAGKALVAAIVVLAMVAVPLGIDFNRIFDGGDHKMSKLTFHSDNYIEGSKIVYESLQNNKKASASNMTADNNKCWNVPEIRGNSISDKGDINNSMAEIQLAGSKTFNTAVIEETGNNVQYFRLQAYINDEWKTIYQSEKIQSLKICSFDAVTTDQIRLLIDKVRDNNTAKIRLLRLYNEPARDAKDFEVTAYQNLYSDVPTQILSKGDTYIKNYAKFYDVYSTVIIFNAIKWDENGDITFGEDGEENFSKQLSALKEIISHRSNKDHKVKLIITALADGTGGDYGGVNVYMSKNMEHIADQIINLVNKYNFDGVDIDWEYPATAGDWKNYDEFISRLDKGINSNGNNRIISSALSAGNLGLSKETFDILDQIQFMAYDGNDTDGYQSSLEQAQEGIAQFIKNGADISKINIGIAAYGRPVNSTPFWANWRDLKQANYWDSKYYNVSDSGQIYDGTFCSPALAGDKTAYALLSGCGGVMVFRVACDKTMDDPNSVACGIQNALNRYVKNW